ncbi:AI-2E family transporter [Cytophagaceae bacterium YF14B1]|uniref:AI-2E family transporter n=1 Tax=Xanthocytophaga flava TaxID=3048013 RepID=A0AAE3U4Q2_9BACT|nr:AI-2E family transporter [Xanthocytophaga flavus]MDJ1479506.1 AI-2E family transporter [Xanthocytophaga flavus]
MVAQFIFTTQMPATKEYPFYLKTTVILFGIILFSYILFTIRDILIPLAFAVVISILLNPVYIRFRRWKTPPVVAITLTLLLAILVLGGILFFLGTQLSLFSDTFPMLKQKLMQIITESQHWLQERFNISAKKQAEYLNKGVEGGTAMVGQTLGTAIGMLGIFFLIPVYVFLFLYYKSLILNFIYEVFAEENSNHVGEILNQTKTAIQSYMVGLMLEMVIVAVMNSVALLLLGVDYAILLGVIGAILNLIPYIGGIIAIALPVLMATVTKDGYTTQLGILAAYALIQFIDNNILVPRIVSSKVEINALVSIIVVLLGGAVWGVSGMFLSIPLVAILKIIFDRIPDLKPWGKLLGDDIPNNHKGQLWKRKR